MTLENVACLALTLKTERHGEPVFRVIGCYQPHQMWHWKQSNFKMDMTMKLLLLLLIMMMMTLLLQLLLLLLMMMIMTMVIMMVMTDWGAQRVAQRRQIKSYSTPDQSLHLPKSPSAELNGSMEWVSGWGPCNPYDLCNHSLYPMIGQL